MYFQMCLVNNKFYERKRCECSENIVLNSRHFGSYKPGNPRGTRHKDRNCAVKSSHLSWTGQYKKCVQYNFKVTSDYSELSDSVREAVEPIIK